MRAFIAIELPQKIKTSLAKLQEELKKSGADVKWVDAQNIHLTLKFLGEIDENLLPRINSTLEEIAQTNQPYNIRLSCLGAFPETSAPRVIWAGIDKGEKETKKINQELEKMAAKIGIPEEERAFSCHITIGRTRSGKNLKNLALSLGDCNENLKKDDLEFLQDKITLFKSTLTPRGPNYEPLKVASLKTA